MPPLDAVDRARRMGQRLTDLGEALGIDRSGRDLISRGYALAMEPRRATLSDDHDPEYLHPGRCAVILMDDLGCIDPATIAAVALLESESPNLAVPPREIEAGLGGDVARLVGGVPLSGAEDLAEQLVVGTEVTRVLALVERLDQVRHAHLWPDMERRRRVHAEACSVYLPVAVRTDATLARRYTWWCSMFGQRHLGD